MLKNQLLQRVDSLIRLSESNVFLLENLIRLRDSSGLETTSIRKEAAIPEWNVFKYSSTLSVSIRDYLTISNRKEEAIPERNVFKHSSTRSVIIWDYLTASNRKEVAIPEGNVFKHSSIRSVSIWDYLTTSNRKEATKPDRKVIKYSSYLTVILLRDKLAGEDLPIAQIQSPFQKLISKTLKSFSKN